LKRLMSLYRPAWPQETASDLVRVFRSDWGVAKW
jgi:hypothetical protein